MVGKAHHPSSSESDYWGDESWTVDCPCGVNFDDGEEMVECDECGVWVHTACCRVPKGLSTFVCDKCKIKKKRECEEVAAEVTYVVVESSPSVEVLLTDRLHKSNDVPIAERVHVQGIPGGEPRMFVGVSEVFGQQLWKFTGYVPKVLHLKLNDVPSWPYADEVPELLPYTSSGKQVCFVNKEDEKMKERELDQYRGNRKDLDLMAEQFPYKEKHTKRDGKKPEGKHSKHRHKPRALKEERLHLHNKRGREEGNLKDPASKKRMRSGGETARTEEELLRGGEGLPLEVGNVTTKCAPSSPKNPKAMKKMAVQEFMDGHVSVCSRCNTREQIEARPHQTPGGQAELLFCHDCEKLQSRSSEDIKVEFRGEFSIPSTVCAPEAAIITHTGTGTGSEDLKSAEQKVEGFSLKVDKCKAENEQLCLSKLEYVQTAISGKEVQLDKKAVVGENRCSERERDGNKYEDLKPVGDDNILVNSLEAEKVDGRRKTNAEIGKTLEISQVISKVEVSKPAGLDFKSTTPETVRETVGVVEVAIEEEQSPGSTSVLIDSPKLSTSGGPSLLLVNSSISPSRKRPRATMWASETTRIASKGAIPSGTTGQGSVVSFGHTLGGKIKASDVVKQDTLSFLSDQKFRSCKEAPSCGEHSTAITDLVGSPRYESLHGLERPVDASGDYVSAPHMDLVAIRKPSENDGEPLSAATMVSLDPPLHSPKAQLEVKDDALSLPSSLNLFGAVMENSVEDKPSSSDRRCQGSARTSGHLPASVREKMLVDRLSLQQQRSNFSPSSSQPIASSHQDYLPPGSVQALTRLGATSKSPGSGQVTKRVLEAEGKTTLPRQPIASTEQESSHEAMRVVCHSILHDLPEQPKLAAQGEAVELSPSSSLPACQQARQPVGNLAHVVVRSRHLPSSSSTASTGSKAPGADTAWTMRSVGMTARHSTSPKASPCSHLSPPITSISPPKPLQGANRSSPSSPPPLGPGPGIPSAKTSQSLASGRPSISASSSSPSPSLIPGPLVSQKSGPLLSASSWPVKPPSAINLSSRTSSLPIVLKFTECNAAAMKPVSVSGLVNRSGSPGVSLPGVIVKEITKPSTSPIVTISPGVRPSLQSSVVKHTSPVLKSVTSQSSKSPPLPASVPKQLCGSLTNPCKPTSGSQVIKTTPTASLKPGSVSSLPKEEKCYLNPVPAPSKIISTMPPPPALVSLKRAPPAIITNLPASSTTMNDEELALKLHQELNSSPRVPRVPRARQAVTGHQLVSSTQSSIVPPAKRPAGAGSAGSSLKEHNLVSKKRLRDDRFKDGIRSSTGDESSKSGSNSLFNTATKLRNSDNTEDAVSEKDGSGRPSDGACAKDRLDVSKTIDKNEVVATQSGFPRRSLSIILPQRGDESSDSGDKRSPGDATKAFPGVNDELLSSRGIFSSEDVNEAVVPHWQRLRKVTGECASQRQDAVDSLPIRTAPDIKSNPSRVQQQITSAAMIESEDEEDGGAFCPPSYHGLKERMIEDKGSYPEDRRVTEFGNSRKDKLQLLEEVPKGKRKARRRRRLAVQGHDGEISDGGHRAEKCAGETEAEEDAHDAGQEDELDVPSSPSSEDAVSNYSEEDEEMVVHRGIRSRQQCEEGESSAGEDDEGD